MGEAIFVARHEHEAAAELEGVLAEPVLAMSTGLRPTARAVVVGAQQVKQGGGAQLRSAVGRTLFVDKEWEPDLGPAAKCFGMPSIAEADGGQVRTCIANPLLVIAQLRDVLAAEDSAVVA